MSSNSKTGPIPTTMTDHSSCPSSCPLKGKSCYAELGYLGSLWNKVDEYKAAMDWEQLCGAVRSLPPKQLWRHNVAGDLPPSDAGNEHIDEEKMAQLVQANKRRKGFTYTHKKPGVGANARVVAAANAGGFTVNLSANNVKEADSYMKLGIAPVVTILPSTAVSGLGTPGVFHATTPGGYRLVVCPASREGSEMTCDRCGVCQIANRKTIIGFPAHGVRKQSLDKQLSGS